MSLLAPNSRVGGSVRMPREYGQMVWVGPKQLERVPHRFRVALREINSAAAPWKQRVPADDGDEWCCGPVLSRGGTI